MTRAPTGPATHRTPVGNVPRLPKSRVAQAESARMGVAKTNDPGGQPEVVLSHPIDGTERMTVADIVAAPHLDGCPECLTRDNAPTSTERVPGGVQCTYTCRSCGCQWTTSWFGGAS